jgi:hypothetical protein
MKSNRPRKAARKHQKKFGKLVAVGVVWRIKRLFVAGLGHPLRSACTGNLTILLMKIKEC